VRVGLAFAVLLLPGLAWWLWLGDRRKDGAQALAEIIAISASFIALGTLGFYTVRLKFTPLLLGILLGLCFGVAFAGLIRRGKGAFNKTWLFALLGFAVALVWRFWQAKDLVFPNWVDSQHHVLIIRKMIEFGGLPSTLEPYLPGPFYYHFGFHAIGALFSALSGLDPAASVLMLGQVISAGVSLAIYALAKQLSKDWRIGLLAAVFVTFVTKMPGYYLSWGRYTLLIGVMILPVAMAEAIRACESHDRWWKLAGLSLLTAGSLLSHYFTAFLFVLFLAVLGVHWLVETIRAKSVNWKPIASVAMATIAGLVLASRWYWRVFRYSAGVMNFGVNLLEQGMVLDTDQIGYLRYILGPEAAYGLIFLAMAGLAWSFFRTDWRRFAIWSLTATALTAPLGLQIMGFRNDHFGLILFAPICILSAACLVWLMQWLDSKIHKPRIVFVGLVLIVVAIVGFGGEANQDVINDSTVLVTLDDIDALKWIEIHTPEDARFFVNTTGWGFGLYRGVDGGGWILPYTGRWSLAPTIFYPYGADENNSATWTDWAKRASMVTTCGTDFWELVEEANLQYVYSREGTSGLQAEALKSCPNLSQLYIGDGVSIWHIDEIPD
jgi:hypothetical protein